MSHDPTIKELRHFGFIVGGIFLLIGLWPVLFRGDDPRLWSLVLGGALMSLASVAPMILKRVYLGWMKIGYILGAVNTRIILGIVYYGLITPMGVVMRLMGKDSMHRMTQPDQSTYRIVRSPRSRHHMRNQF